jgi:hypothetical protein
MKKANFLKVKSYFNMTLTYRLPHDQTLYH